MSAAAGLDPVPVQTSINTNGTKRHAQNVRKKYPWPTRIRHAKIKEDSRFLKDLESF